MTTPQQRPRYEDWTSSPKTRIYTRSPREPRDEQARSAKTSPRSRPAPINIATGQTSLLKSPPSPRPSEDDTTPPSIPQIIDFGDDGDWPRRGLRKHQPTARKHNYSPSVGSRCSTRGSELFGVLDYYMREPSPFQSPAHPPPRIGAPLLGPAIEDLNFEFNRSTLSVLIPSTNGPNPTPMIPDAQAGADRESEDDLIASSRSAPTSRSESKNTYTLFPAVRNATSIRTIYATEPQTSSIESVTLPTFRPSLDPSYRPRKESILSSVRSRKDSLTSFQGTRRIPLRILSRSSTSPPHTHSCTLNHSPSNSPGDSRWSDETITSPVVATTPGLRASFGSFSREERGGSGRYPACFLEDDDEDDETIPLRRKLLWKRKANEGGVAQDVQWRRPGRFDGREGLGRKVLRGVLCIGCCG